MKANELSCKDLMVGDWVKPKNVDGSFRVGLIGVDSVWNDTDTHEWYYDEIEPIQLTADILNKNFPDTEDGVFWAWDDRKEEENWFEIRIEKDDVDFRMDMRYVHELQHALRLCGIEKEIIL